MSSIQFGTYTPQEKKKILLIKLEGPFNRDGKIEEKPVAGHNYIFKAYTDTIPWGQMMSSTPANVKWAKLEKDKIVELTPEKPYFVPLDIRTWDSTKNCYVYSREIAYEHMLLYAYLDSPSNDVSLLLGAGKSPFYYKGTKKWGQLQKNDTVISNILKQGRNTYVSNDKAGILGANVIDELKKNTEEEVCRIYEGGDFSQINLGTKDVLRSETAQLVINNFYTGGGKKLSFDENSRISKDLASNSNFKKYFTNYLNVIRDILEKKDIITIDSSAIEELFRSKKYSKHPNFSSIKEMYVRDIRTEQHEFYGLMGGTQTIKVDLEIKEESENIYKVLTKMYIGDWYGSDWGDVYRGKSFDEIFFEKRTNQNWFGKLVLHDETSKAAHAEFQLQKKQYIKGYIPSLNAFFMLQYYFNSGNKYKPFETEIIYKSEDKISINRNK